MSNTLPFAHYNPDGSLVDDPKEVQDRPQLTSEQVAATQALVSGTANREYPIKQFGVVEQAKRFSNAQMTAGSPVLTITGHTFTDDDIGKTVGIKGPGPGDSTTSYATVANDGVLVGTILSVSGDTATLSEDATQTATDCACIIGRPIDDAVAAAVAQCQADYALDGVGGTIVIPGGQFVASASVPISSGVSFSGGRRDSSHVYVVKITDNASDVFKSAWIRRNGAISGRYDAVNVTQLTLIGTFLASSGPYGSDMKMIHMNATNRSFVTWCRIVDNPSTALGYDNSTDCELAFNIIVNPGRLARPSTSAGNSGGSGIGIAVGSEYVSMHVHHNHIRSNLTATSGTGRSGINIEASAGTPNPPAFGGQGIIVESNIIEGFYNGIVDSGAQASKIVNNNIRKCCHGIKSGSNGIPYGRMSRDTIISGNDIRDGFAFGGNYAVGIFVTVAPGTSADAQSGIAQQYGRVRVVNNFVDRTTGGYGIVLLSFATGLRPTLGVVVDNNTVSNSDLSGIRVLGVHINLQLTNNMLISNGRANTPNNKAPIIFETDAAWTNGWFHGNSYLDPESSPTQDASPTLNNVVLTNVWAAEKVLALINGTVANLPAASTAYSGFRATVKDANAAYTAANVGATVAAGGANSVPVFCDGTNWVIG